MKNEWGTSRLLNRRTLRVTLGCVWIVDGLLQAEPSKFASGYPLGSLAQSAMGSPAWVRHLVLGGIHPFVAQWAVWNLGSTLLQLTIGICLVSGRFVRPALLASFGWAASIWLLGEAFGMLPSGFALLEAGAPGPVLLYAGLGAMAWPVEGRSDVDRRTWVAAWSILWVGGAALHLPFVYSGGRVLQANLSMLSQGSPPVLAGTSHWFSGIVAHHGGAVVLALATVELMIGLGGALDRSHLRAWLAAGIASSLFFWVVVQQVGGMLTSGGTDPSLGPLLVLLALSAWPRTRRTAPDRAPEEEPVEAGLEPVSTPVLVGASAR